MRQLCKVDNNVKQFHTTFRKEDDAVILKRAMVHSGSNMYEAQSFRSLRSNSLVSLIFFRCASVSWKTRIIKCPFDPSLFCIYITNLLNRYDIAASYFTMDKRARHCNGACKLKYIVKS